MTDIKTEKMSEETIAVLKKVTEVMNGQSASDICSILSATFVSMLHSVACYGMPDKDNDYKIEFINGLEELFISSINHNAAKLKKEIKENKI